MMSVFLEGHGHEQRQIQGTENTQGIQTAWRLSTLGFKANARRSLKSDILPVSVLTLCQEILDRFQHNIRCCSSLLHGASLIHKLKTNILMEDARLIQSRLTQKSQQNTHVVASIATITQICERAKPDYLASAEHIEHWAMVPEFTFDCDRPQKKRKIDCAVIDTSSGLPLKEGPLVPKEGEHLSIVNGILDSNEVNHNLDFELDVENLQPIVPLVEEDKEIFDIELEGLLEVESLLQIREQLNNPVTGIQSHSITNDPNFGLSGADFGFPIGMAPIVNTPNKTPPKSTRCRKLVTETDVGSTYLVSQSITTRQKNYYHEMCLQSPCVGKVYEEVTEKLKKEPIRLLRSVFRVFLRRSIPEVNKQIFAISATVSHLEGMNTELEFERRMLQFEIPHNETEIGRNLYPQPRLLADEDSIEFAFNDIDVPSDTDHWNDDVPRGFASDLDSETESFGLSTRPEFRETNISTNPHATVRLNRFMYFLESRCAELHQLPTDNSLTTNITFAQLIPSVLAPDADAGLTPVSRRHAAKSFSSLLVLATCTKIEIDCKKHAHCSLMTSNDVIIRVPK